MKTLKEFQEFFERELRPQLARVQAERDATRPRFWRQWRWWLLAACVLTFGVMILQATKIVPQSPWIVAPLPIMWGLTLIVVPIVLGVRISRWSGKHEGGEKKLTVVPAIRFLVPEFEYKTSKFIPAERVKASRLFELDGKLAGVSGDDHFAGKVGESAVEFSEVSVTTTRRVKRDGKWKTERTTDQGLFLVADFNKPFQHATMVLPDPGEKLLGAEVASWLGGVIDFMNQVEKTAGAITGRGTARGEAPTAAEAGWQTVRLDHADFERQFRVLCTDPVEAHYILTPNIMERLAAFQQRLRYPLALSFVDTAMHAFIHSGALFEGDVDQDVTQFAAYQTYYEQLYVVFDLVEAMQLNTRLWTKP